MKKTKDNIKTKIPLSRQGVALLTEEVLQVMNVLQSTLDIIFFWNYLIVRQEKSLLIVILTIKIPVKK